MGKPILALSPPEGEIGQIIRETSSGWCVDPDDAPGISVLLISALERLDQNCEWRPNRDAIRQYEWPNLIARMVKRMGLGAQS